MYNNNFHLFQIICWLCVSCPISVSICVNVNVYSQNYGFHVLMLILAFLILVLIFKYLLDSHSFGKHVWPFFLSRKLYLQCQIVCTMHLLLILNPIYRQWRWSHVLITGSVYLFIEGIFDRVSVFTDTFSIISVISNSNILHSYFSKGWFPN